MTTIRPPGRVDATENKEGDQTLVDWLITASNPILRYRAARDLAPGYPPAGLEQLRQEAAAAPETLRWLGNLRCSTNVHGSRDVDGENALAKLLEYGFDRSLPAFDAGVQSLLENRIEQPWDRYILPPFLIHAGYIEHPLARDWFDQRIDTLYQNALKGNYDFYLDPAEAVCAPPAWRGKPIYRDEVGHEAAYPIPTCYDLYALAYCPALPDIPDLNGKMETITAYLSDRRFQTTIGGYGWNKSHGRCYAAGRAFLACAEQSRLTLFLELGARFSSVRQSAWFRKGLALLESCRTPLGRYCFPPELMMEKAGSFIYGGCHMGLGENRRKAQALELESTFRMLYIRKRMDSYDV
jgi:hypothetical protein